jgi:hypothetical protein
MVDNTLLWPSPPIEESLDRDSVHVWALTPTPGFIAALDRHAESARLSCRKFKEKEQFEYAYC